MAEQPTDAGFQWFVLHTLSGQEQKVKDSIEKRMKIEEVTDLPPSPAPRVVTGQVLARGDVAGGRATQEVERPGGEGRGRVGAPDRVSHRVDAGQPRGDQEPVGGPAQSRVDRPAHPQRGSEHPGR